MPEFNPANERLKKEYEDALLHGAHKEIRTADAAWKAINMFEDFTGKKDFKTFNTEQAKGFKRWLIKRRNGKDEPLSVSTISRILSNVREFFKWLAIHPKYIRKVDGQSVIYLRMSNNEERAGRATREQPVPSIEEVRKALLSMPDETDVQKRNRALIAFVALTGVRDAALISLKMKDIDLKKREIWQDPRHVKTKNRKGITTVFMPFDPLWEDIVIDWVRYAHDVLEFRDDDPVFPKELVIPDPEKMKFTSAGLSNDHWSNTNPVRKIFQQAFTHANLPYYRPHSFRKMLVIWAMDNCNQMQVKAISQNIGHEHAMTTYNAYGTLNMHAQRTAILNIGEGNPDLQNVPMDELLNEVSRRAGK